MPIPLCARIQGGADVHDHEPLFGSPRVMDEEGIPARARRELEFEVILSIDLPTRISWLDFTAEAIFLPFDRESRNWNSKPVISMFLTRFVRIVGMRLCA